MIDRLDLTITLPPGTEKDGAVEKCEDIFRNLMLPALDRVFAEYDGRNIEAGRVKVDLGSVSREDIPSRLEGELRRILAGLDERNTEERALLRRKSFAGLLDGKPVLQEKSAVSVQEVMYAFSGHADEHSELSNVIRQSSADAFSGAAGQKAYSVPEDTSQMHEDTVANAISGAAGQKAGSMSADGIPSAASLRREEAGELLSLAVEKAGDDKRVFYRMLELIGARGLPEFVLRMARCLSVPKDISRKLEEAVLLLEDVLCIPEGGSHGREENALQLPGEAASAKEIVAVFSCMAESLLYKETPLPGLQELTTQGIRHISEGFEDRKMVFLESAAVIQDPPESIGSLSLDDAGVMLLSPFFGNLFSCLGYLDKSGNFRSLRHRIRAVHLLRCVSHGFEERHKEGDLVLSKVLCGLSPLFPITGKYRILEKEKLEVGEMMAAALGYWNSLKGTSPDGLRQAFLCRDGILEPDEAGWTVRVEGKAIDILLEDLPWGISIFSPSWSEFGIFTDWQKENGL